MKTIRTQFLIGQAGSSLGVGSNPSREATENGFIAISLTVGDTDQVISYGDLQTPKEVVLVLDSGDPVQIGLDGATYPFRLSFVGQPSLLPLDVEGLREISTIICEADDGSLPGKYFDIEDRNGVVRVYFTTGDAVGIKASGFITYGVPDPTDTVIVNGTTLTCVAAAPGAFEFTDIAELEALVEAITGINASEDGVDVTVEAATVGAAGNAITLALGTNTGTMEISGATLTGGVDAFSAPANPGSPGDRLLAVTYASFDTALTLAALLAAAMEADSEFLGETNGVDTVTMTDQHIGARTTIDAGDVGWTVASIQVGADAPEIHVKSTGTSQILLGVVPN